MRVLITGGSSGLGRAFAENALARGWRCAVTTRSTSRVRAAFGRDKAVAIVESPLRSHDQVERAFHSAVEGLGGIDLLVNNAGAGWFGALEHVSEAELQTLFHLNVHAPLKLCQLAAAQMRDGGVIVNISSSAGLLGGAGYAAYAASKAALSALTEGLREELAARRIRVLLVEPGAVATAFLTRSSRFEAPNDPASPASQALAAIRAHADRPDRLDPRELAESVLTAALQPATPHRLVLGSDAAGTAREKIAALQIGLAD